MTWLKKPNGTAKGKTALALGGGGVRGVAHLGVIHFLEENELDRWDFLVGTSAGSIFGALFLLYGNVEQARDRMATVIRSMKKSRGLLSVTSSKSNFLANIKEKLHTARSLLKLSIIDAEPLREFIVSLVGETTTFSDLRKPLYVVATDLKSGRDVVFSRGELLPALMATSSIPGVFPPVTYRGYHLVDGGITHKLPTRIAYGLGARRVLGVDVGGGMMVRNRFSNPIEVIIRSEEIASQALHDRNRDAVGLLLTPRFNDMKWYEFTRHPEAYEAGLKAAAARGADLRRFFRPGLGRYRKTPICTEENFILE